MNRKYKIYFGKFTIYGAESVETSLARPVAIYDGLGVGEYPIPDNKKLTEWTIKGQWTENNDYGMEYWTPAHELKDGLEKVMKGKDHEQLVMTNGYEKTSKPAYITDVNVTETSPGVFSYIVKLTEYKKTTVRTTGVPTITRPGKIPEMPKTVVLEKPSDVAGYAYKGNYDVQDFDPSQYQYVNSGRLQYCWVSPDGVVKETTNPNLVPIGTPVNISPESAPSTQELAESLRDNETSIGPVSRKVGQYNYGDINNAISNFWTNLTNNAQKSAYEKWEEENQRRLEIMRGGK